MKKNLPIIVICCTLIIGVCVLLYPVVSAILAKMTQSTTISNYQKAVENLSNDEIDKMKAEAEKYNRSLYGNHLTDPFADGKTMDESYVQLLNVGKVMGYIEIPKINVYLPIYHGTSKEVLDKGVGHLANSSLPIGGDSTHTVLTGHRGLPSATLFTDLDQLNKDDVFYLHIFNDINAYKINQIKVVKPEDTEDLTIVKGKDYISIITCTPYGINTHRLIVRGTRIPYVIQKKSTRIKIELVDDVAIIPVGFLIIVILPFVLLVRKKKRGRYEKTY